MKKVILLSGIALSLFSCSKAVDQELINEVKPSFVAAGTDECREFKTVDGITDCYPLCESCALHDAVVTPGNNGIALELDGLVGTNNATNISDFFLNSDWQSLNPELSEAKWANVLALLQNGDVDRIDKFVNGNGKIFYKFFDAQGNMVYVLPLINS